MMGSGADHGVGTGLEDNAIHDVVGNLVAVQQPNRTFIHTHTLALLAQAATASAPNTSEQTTCPV
eukprot:2241973-Rhodomonas_salina.1